VFIRLADDDTEEGGLLALVHRVGVIIHITEKARVARMSVDPANGT
jgi:hypothetical protein